MNWLRVRLLGVAIICKRKMNRWTNRCVEGVIDKQEIQKYLPIQPIVVDAGANNGYDSIEMAMLWGAKVYAFEPVPQIFDRLVRNTRGMAQIQCTKVALSDAQGTIDMRVADASSTTLSVDANQPNLKFEDTVMVEKTTLDAWCDAQNIPRVDLLWYDMEGADLLALKGSEHMLKGSVVAIHVEVSQCGMYGVGCTYDQVKEYLGGLDFIVEKEALSEDNRGGNVLFVKHKN